MGSTEELPKMQYRKSRYLPEAPSPFQHFHLPSRIGPALTLLQASLAAPVCRYLSYLLVVGSHMEDKWVIKLRSTA